MIVPSKFTEIDKSSMVKCISILDNLTVPISVSELLDRTRKTFDTVEDFILALDVLWILDKIDIDFNSGIISHAE